MENKIFKTEPKYIYIYIYKKYKIVGNLIND